MGADFLLAHVWTTKRPDEIDFEAGDLYIATARPEELEEYGWLETPEEIDAARTDALSDLLYLRGVWNGREYQRDIDVCTFGPVTVAITGGMSWGDGPTDSFDILTRIPEGALRAAGFFQ